MEKSEISAAIEGILFAAGDSVNIERICECLEISEAEAEEAIKNLSDFYSFNQRGIRLLRLENSCQLCSAPELGDIILKTLETRKPPKLSQAALETLTVIAYYQPTTRGYIEQIRGVDSSYSVGLLLDRGLIEEAGTLNVPGRPRLFRTTESFLRAFGLNSLGDLPELDESGMPSVTEDASVQDEQLTIDFSSNTGEGDV